MRTIEKLEEGNYYHIYNRGVNGENIFVTPHDYADFLDRFFSYSKDVLDIFSYCLLKNHFHSLVYVKENVVVPRRDGKGEIRLDASNQLSHCFNGYAQAFNRDYQRTGALFEKPFKRKSIESTQNLAAIVLYIHNNPTHHGFTNDVSDWSYSSYDEILKDVPTILNRSRVLEWFGGRENFITAHKNYMAEKRDEKWMIE